MRLGWPPGPHRRWQGAASAYIDGELGGRALRDFELHLAQCAVCREQVAGLRQASALIAALPEVAAPRSFRLTRAMVEQSARPQASGSPSWLFRGAAVVSGAALIALISVVAIDLSSPGEETASLAAPASGNGAFSNSASGAGGVNTEGQAAPPAAPASTPAPKGIAVPEIGGTGAQSVPSTAPGSIHPEALGTRAADAAGAPSPGSKTDGVPHRPADEAVPSLASRNEGDTPTAYRALEAGLAVIALGAAAGAVVTYKRKGRS
ncbi:MAG: zf-HC2 domain-containing protein [Dehalococcoidia bacterium]|nr:zf-HC2 domain-containing protein [Dehalococcoidia bacterium]